MPIFKIHDDRLRLVGEKRIGLESELQVLTEKNLNEIFGLKFISGRRNREFSLHGFRIDTLGFDPENRSFVIIEYKRDKSFSIIDQGYSYLSLMLSHKADFILEYNEHLGANLKRRDVDWSQSKVIFIANNFTNHQRNAINFKDLPIELWKVKIYDNDTILYMPLPPSNGSSESAKTLASKTSQKSAVEQVSRELRLYALDDHLSDKSESIVEIVESLSEGIIGISSMIKEIPQKQCIIYRTNRNIAEVEVRRWNVRVKINISMEKLRDLSSLCGGIRRNSYLGTEGNEIIVDNIDDVPHAVCLIKRAFEVNQ